MKRDNFTHVGTDEDQNVIGCCKVCGCNGVLIHVHQCKKDIKITYRTKTTPLAIAIQADIKPDTDIKDLICELIVKGFTHVQSNIPPSFNNGKETHYFYREGSGMYGFKTEDELHDFVSDSADVLIKFDPTFNRTLIYEYDNI